MISYSYDSTILNYQQHPTNHTLLLVGNGKKSPVSLVFWSTTTSLRCHWGKNDVVPKLQAADHGVSILLVATSDLMNPLCHQVNDLFMDLLHIGVSA